MIIGFLKKNPLWALILTPIIAIAVWVHSYLHHFAIVESGTPLYENLIAAIGPSNKITFALLGFALVLSQAIHLNYILVRFEVLYKQSWMPSVFYILLMSIIPQFVVFHPILIINSIIILQLSYIFQLYKGTDTFGLDFNICALTGIASMLYIPALLLLLLYFIALMILKPFAWRDWIIGILGLATPYIFIFVYFFLTDQYNYLSTKFFITNIQQQFDFLKIFPMNFVISVAFVAVLFLLSLIRLGTNFYKNVIRSRNYQQILLISLLVLSAIVLISTETMLFKFTILCTPLSVLIGYYFIAAKKPLWYETLFILLLANIVFNYYVSVNH